MAEIHSALQVGDFTIKTVWFITLTRARSGACSKTIYAGKYYQQRANGWKNY